MEKSDEEYIIQNLSDLIKLTDCNPALIGVLMKRGILGHSDMTKLVSLADMSERSFHLYRLCFTRRDAYSGLYHALLETGQRDAVNIFEAGKPSVYSTPEAKSHRRKIESKRKLEEEKHKSSAQSKESRISSVSFGLKAPASLFTGRVSELAELHQLVSSSSPASSMSVITQTIASVRGLGGIGKTQLARKYVQQYGSHYDDNVIWIDAQSEESLSQSFRLLASDILAISTVNADGNPKHVSTIVSKVYGYFAKAKCIFVFDNAEVGPYLKPFLPNFGRPSEQVVLLTSRDQEWGPTVKILNLGVLKLQEAIDFVKAGLHLEEGDQTEEILELVELLQYFPLALQQAISYIEDQRSVDDYQISDYITEFKSDAGGVLLDSDLDLTPDLFNDYTKTTFRTWQITIAKIGQDPKFGRLAVEILNVIGFLAPDGIPRELFFNLEEESFSEMQVKRAVRLLVKYSMVEGYDHQKVLSVHRLVQQVIRIQLGRQGREVEVLRSAVRLVAEAMDGENAGLSQALAVFSHAMKVPELVRDFSTLPANIVSDAEGCYRFEEGIAFAKEHYSTLEHIFGGGDEDFMEFEVKVGLLYAEYGDFEEATRFLKRARERYISSVEEEEEDDREKENEDSLKIQQDIGWLAYNQGKYEECFQIFKKLNILMEEVLGEDHELTLDTLSKTAAVAVVLMEYEAAADIIQRLMVLLEKTNDNSGEGAVPVVNYELRRNLGKMKAQLGDPEGVEMLRKLYSQLEAEGDPELDKFKEEVMHTLSFVLHYYKDPHGEGFEISEKLYQRRKEVLGEDHPETVKMANNMGLYQLAAGSAARTEESPLAAFQRAYQKTRETYGPQFINSLLMLENIGLAHSVQGRHSEALTIFVEMFEGLGELAGKRISFVVEMKVNYAEVLERCGRNEEALQILKEVRQAYEESCGGGGGTEGGLKNVKPPRYADCLEAIMRVESKMEG